MQGYTRPLGLLSPQRSSGSEIAVAAGASSTIDAMGISAGKTGKLHAVRVACSLAVKVELQVVDGSPITVETRFDGEWNTPHEDFITASAGANFRVVVTNMDPELAADIYVSFFWDET